MPTRIIDVGQSEIDEVRLCDHGGPLEFYIALSHCWGKHPLIRTLSKNIDEHRREIPMESLPPTFREVISFARRLGIRFLWIDSLCIIQDDGEDWAREAAKMASVYQNAYLVISATKSAGSDGGLFSNLDPQLKSHTAFVCNDQGEQERVCFRRTVPRPNRFSSSFPTLSRGWIFQERFLSRRFLHFGPEELFWECLEESACQCTLESTVPIVQTKASGDQQKKFYNMDQAHHRPKAYHNSDYWKSLDEIELRRSWHRLVEGYTTLRLTYDGDIFPALSGLSKVFQTVQDSRYLAGLWEKTLLHDLLWHLDPRASEAAIEGLSLERPQSYRAPTWSWASTRWPITFLDMRHDGDWDFLCEVLGADCALASADPTGAVESGHLLLKGPLLDSTLVYETEGPAHGRLYSESIMDQHGAKTMYTDYDVRSSGSGHIASGSSIHYLVIGTGAGNRTLGALMIQHEGEDIELQCRVYRRIGLIEVTTSSKVDWFGDFMPADMGKTLVKII